MTTPWSTLGPGFLREGNWADGQGVDAPDRQMLRDLLRKLQPVSLLDVGCGTGIELDGILADGVDCRYTGIDFTPEFVEACRERFPHHHFYCADLYQMKPPAFADVVSARAVLEHVADEREALRMLYQAARRVLVVSFFIAPGEQSFTARTHDGFIQRRYSRSEIDAAVGALAAEAVDVTEYRHAGQDWAVWRIWRKR